MSEKNTPVKRLKVWPNEASIWRQQGERGSFYNVTFGRTYKDGEDYKTSTSFGRDDLLSLAKLADQAHTQVLKLEHADRIAAAENHADDIPDAVPN